MPGRLAPNMLVPGQLPEYSSYKFAPVAQRIEHWPPEPGAAVRVRPGVPNNFYYSYELAYPPFLLPLPAPQVCFPSGNTRQSGQARRPLNFHAGADHTLKGPGPPAEV